MEVKSSKPKGQRMFKCINFNHKTYGKTRRSYWIEPLDYGWVLSTDTGEWYRGDNAPKRGITTAYHAMTSYGFNNIYSLKAAKRKIAKWNVPKGTKFLVSLPFVGYEFTITKS